MWGRARKGLSLGYRLCSLKASVDACAIQPYRVEVRIWEPPFPRLAVPFNPVAHDGARSDVLVGVKCVEGGVQIDLTEPVHCVVGAQLDLG